MSETDQNTYHPIHRHLFGVLGNSLLAIVIVASFIGSAYFARLQNLSPQVAAVISSTLVSLTNDTRASNALGQLSTNALLTQAAQEKANDMAAKSYFAHTSPEGLTSWYWFQKVGYDYSYAGENLAVDFSDSIEVDRAWLNSPTHRANIVNSHYTEIGIATAVGLYKGHQATFVVQMFGRPKPTTPTYAGVGPSSLPAPIIASLGTTSRPAALVAGTTTPVVAPGSSSSPVSTYAETSTSPVMLHGSAAAVSAFSPIASPRTALHVLYVLIALLILAGLIRRIRSEAGFHHKRHLTVAVILIILMVVLFIVGDIYIFRSPVLPGESAQISY